MALFNEKTENEYEWLELEESLQRRLNARRDRLEIEENLIPDDLEQGDVDRLTDKVLLNAFAQDMQKSFFDGKSQSPIDSSSPEAEKESFRRLDETLKKEDHATVEEELPKEQDPLELILQDVRVYCRIQETANSILRQSEKEPDQDQNNNNRKREERLAKRIMRRITALSEQLDAQNEEANRSNGELLREIAEEAKRRGTNELLLRHSPEYQDRWKEGAEDERVYAVSNLKAFFEAQLYGQLGLIPEEPIREDAHHLIETDTYIRLEKAEDEALRRQNENHTLEIDRRDALMFPHSPSPNDVQQFGIGDCFLAANLSEIAAKHPQKIKEMIRDNRDGTATVRLYHRVKDGNVPDAFEPFYVTVDKVMTKGQARGSLWVQTMERALTVSGLLESEYELERDGVSVESETSAARSPHPWGTFGRERPKNWVPSFSMVDGSRAAIAMSALLGNDVSTSVKLVSAGIEANGSGPLSAAQLPTIRVDRPMNKKETGYVNTIKTAIKAGAVVCAASCSHQGNDGRVVVGINKSHMYSVLGVVEKEINGHRHCFVKLRNPHGNAGRDYKLVNTPAGEQILQPVCGEAGMFSDQPISDGTCYVEIRHFKHEFQSVTFGDVKESSLEKTQRIANEERRAMDAYRKAFKDIYEYLDEEVSSLRGSSKEYDALKAALKTAYKKPAENYAELENRVEELYDAMNAYQLHSAEVAGDPTLRMHKAHACNALSIVLQAAGKGFMGPKAYAEARIADKVLEDIERKYAESEQKDTPKVKAALDLIRNDRAAARKNVMKSAAFRKAFESDVDMVQLGRIAYGDTAVFRVIDPAMAAPEKKEFTPKTTDQLRAERGLNRPANGPANAPANGPANGPRMAPRP